MHKTTNKVFLITRSQQFKLELTFLTGYTLLLSINRYGASGMIVNILTISCSLSPIFFLFFFFFFFLFLLLACFTSTFSSSLSSDSGSESSSIWNWNYHDNLFLIPYKIQYTEKQLENIWNYKTIISLCK